MCVCIKCCNQLLLFSHDSISRHGTRLVSGNITVECNSSSYFTLKEVHIFKRMKKAGNLSSCMLSSTSHNLWWTIADLYPCRYEKRKRKDGTPTYHFIGYSTLYPFYCFPEMVRMRLRYVKLHLLQLRLQLTFFSQFVILPPYQHIGHGGMENLKASLTDRLIRFPTSCFV